MCELQAAMQATMCELQAAMQATMCELQACTPGPLSASVELVSFARSEHTLL